MQVWWLRKIHVSWLIGGWCLGAIIGVVIAAVLPYGWFSSLGWLLLGLALLTRLNTQILLPPLICSSREETTQDCKLSLLRAATVGSELGFPNTKSAI